MKKNLVIISLLCFTFFISLQSFSPSISGLDKDVLKYTNDLRRSKHLGALTENEDLDKMARRHSEDMASGRVGYGHGGFSLRFQQAQKSIPGCRTLAENVAYGVRTGRDAVTMWKNSAPHRKNMLGNYRYIGIGTAKDRKGVIYYTQIFAN